MCLVRGVSNLYYHKSCFLVVVFLFLDKRKTEKNQKINKTYLSLVIKVT